MKEDMIFIITEVMQFLLIFHISVWLLIRRAIHLSEFNIMEIFNQLFINNKLPCYYFYINTKIPIVEMKEKKQQVRSGDKKKKQGNEKQKVVNIRDLVKKNKNFQILENGKIKCLITGHELPATLDEYNKYINSKSYKRGLESQYDISEYDLIIVEHKNDPKYFYCQLTGVKIPKKKSALDKHINGKKFQRRFQQLKQEQQRLEQNGQDFQRFEEQQEQPQEQVSGQKQVAKPKKVKANGKGKVKNTK